MRFGLSDLIWRIDQKLDVHGNPLLLYLIAAGAGAASAAGSAYSANKTSNTQTALTKAQIAENARQHDLDLAFQESTANPFRHQAAQASTLSALDELERGKYTPVSMTPNGPYAKYVPKVSGGYSYEKSPELTASAGALKQDVMAGHAAPSVMAPRTNLTGTPITNPPMTPDGTAIDPSLTSKAPNLATMNLLQVLYPDLFTSAIRTPPQRRPQLSR